MTKDTSSSKASGWGRVINLVRIFVVVLITAAMVPVAYFGWRELYSRFLERTPPRIEPVDTLPRGIGLAPVVYRLKLVDEGAGLDEVVVRVTQKGRSQEVMREAPHGKLLSDVSFQFPHERVVLEEGRAVLDIKVFDKSFWSNVGELTFDVIVDYRKPELEVLTTQHNAVVGGSQLILYKAFDENLAYSGVKVGGRTFEGFPAKVLDEDFAQYPAIFAAIYAVPADLGPDKTSLKLFAEDTVGNAASTAFPNKMAPRQWRDVNVEIKEGFLREQVLAMSDRNFPRMQARAAEAGEKLEYQTKITSPDRLLENFRLVNERLREIDRDEIERLVNGRRFEKLWQGAFWQQSGVVQRAYGQILKYRYQGEIVGESFEQGYEIRISREDRGVIAANDGIVAFVENVGIYGRVLGIDHGLGIFTVYGQLESTRVSKGESVSRGQVIGTAGKSGLGRVGELYFEMRVQGVPVDVREWWDKEWYFAHILEKINDVKLALGLQVFQGFK